VAQAGQRKCRSCAQFFVPDRRNRTRQRYCASAACRRASKIASQAAWVGKPENQDYFRDPCHAARVRAWRAVQPVANVRVHAQTHQRPVDRFAEGQANLRPLHPVGFNLARVCSVRVSPQFRVALDANHYSVPARYAGQNLLLKAYPDRVCVYYRD